MGIGLDNYRAGIDAAGRELSQVMMFLNTIKAVSMQMLIASGTDRWYTT